LRRHAKDIPDPGGVAHVGTWIADTNNIVGRSDAGAGSSAQGRVTVAAVKN
jgi:hypothetical protein